MKTKFKILVPTRGRTTAKACVLNNLPEELLYDTIMCCPPDEVKHWSKYVQTVGVPVAGIGKTRQWLTQRFADEADVLVMVDDDLHFCARDTMASPKLHIASAAETTEAFHTMVQLAMEYGTCGVSARSGNNHCEERVEFNARTFSFYAFRPWLLLAEGIDWSKMALMEDFHVFLTLMSRGYDVPKLCDFCFDQPQSNSDGGCSIYRNAASQAGASYALQTKFPDFVKVVEKATKGGWFGGDGKRVDVTVQWKKAAASGKANHPQHELMTLQTLNSNSIL